MALKVVILQDVLAPYRIELFNRLSEIQDCDLRVLYLFPSLKNLQWKMDEVIANIRFKYTPVEPRAITMRGRKYHLGVKLYMALGSARPDLIISGELGVNTLTALIYARSHHIPLVAWWAGTGETEKDTSRFKRLIRSMLVRHIDRFIAYSRAAAVYLKQLGIRSEYIHVAGNVSFDARDYKSHVDQERTQGKNWREAAGISPNQLVLLSVGGLIPRKNHDLLLDVIAEIPPTLRRSFWVLVVGDGPLRKRLEDKARLAGVNARFLGHVDPANLYRYYALADIFVHLTLRDHWSQAVNEAMASGLPVVVSRYDHAVELIEHGKDGFIVDPAQPGQIREFLEQCAAHPERLAAAGEAAYRKISRSDISLSFETFREVIGKFDPGSNRDRKASTRDRNRRRAR